MSNGRKNSDPGGTKQVRPPQTFQEMVASATLQKFAPYIQQQVKQAVGMALRRSEESQEMLYIRVMALESILLEKIPGLTKEDLVGMVATTQDRAEGFEPRNGAAEKGDRVRLVVKTKAASAPDWDGESKILIDNCGLGRTLGPEIEGHILGLKAGESKEFKFGKDDGFVGYVAIDRVSYQPVEEPAPEVEAAVAAEAAAAVQQQVETPVMASACVPAADALLAEGLSVPGETQTQEASDASPNAG